MVMQEKNSLQRDDMTLSSRLVAEMRRYVIEGKFAPGDHLKERELCEMFDVSRSVLREAVQNLLSEGLIESVPHKGLLIPRIDQKSAIQLYKVRAALEALAAAQFTENANDEQRERLFRICEEIEGLSDDDEPASLVAVKNDFYDCLLAGSGNEILAHLFTQINNRISMLRRLSLSSPGRLSLTKKEIRAIVEAIRNRLPEIAARLSEQHVERAAAVVIASLNGQTKL